MYLIGAASTPTTGRIVIVVGMDGSLSGWLTRARQVGRKTAAAHSRRSRRSSRCCGSASGIGRG